MYIVRNFILCKRKYQLLTIEKHNKKMLLVY